jgi:hypothetical protein
MGGEERRAAALYEQARATTKHMLAAVEDPAWHASLRRYRPVQIILGCAARASS